MNNKQVRTESEKLCIAKVFNVTLKQLEGEFFEFPGRLDNGIDGIIVWTEKGNVTDVIYVQCKGGDSYFPKNTEYRFRVQNISKEYIKKHRPIWMATSSPMIMVVTNSNDKAWWVDLKSNDSYDLSGECVYIDPLNIFNKKANRELEILLKMKTRQSNIPELKIDGLKLPNYIGKESVKSISKRVYNEYKTRSLASNL